LEYKTGLIKEESTSELLRFTIHHILNQVGNDRIYHYLEQQQQQQFVNPVALSSTATAITTADMVISYNIILTI
jgi:hypothetical protein